MADAPAAAMQADAASQQEQQQQQQEELSTKLKDNMKRTYLAFADREGAPPPEFLPAQKMKLKIRQAAEYGALLEQRQALNNSGTTIAGAQQTNGHLQLTNGTSKEVTQIINQLDEEAKQKAYAEAAERSGSKSLVMYAPSAAAVGGAAAGETAGTACFSTSSFSSRLHTFAFV